MPENRDLDQPVAEDELVDDEEDIVGEEDDENEFDEDDEEEEFDEEPRGEEPTGNMKDDRGGQSQR